MLPVSSVSNRYLNISSSIVFYCCTVPYKEKIIDLAGKSLADNESKVTAAASKIKLTMAWWPWEHWRIDSWHKNNRSECANYEDIHEIISACPADRIIDLPLCKTNCHRFHSILFSTNIEKRSCRIVVLGLGLQSIVKLPRERGNYCVSCL